MRRAAASLIATTASAWALEIPLAIPGALAAMDGDSASPFAPVKTPCVDPKVLHP